MEYNNKRMDTTLMSLLLAPQNRKSVLVASGPYKMRHVPLRIRLIDEIHWFIRCDKKNTKKLIKNVHALGQKRNIGYGMVSSWEFEEVEEDNSIFGMCRGKPVLMKTIPNGPHMENVTGFVKEFRGVRPPLWHPENMMECCVPC